MSFAILTSNFPTHVPPYFCTSHLASGLIVFWCKFGGVDTEDDLEDNGDGVDIQVVRRENILNFLKIFVSWLVFHVTWIVFYHGLRRPGGFHRDNMDILAEIKKIPPVTRFLCGSSLAVTGATIASIVSPYSVLFAKELVFKKFEVLSLLILEFWNFLTRLLRFRYGGCIRVSFMEVSTMNPADRATRVWTLT